MEDSLVNKKKRNLFSLGNGIWNFSEEIHVDF